MKRRMCITMLQIILAGICSLSAQNGYTHAMEISYQHYIDVYKRLEFDLVINPNGWKDGFELTVLHEWMHPLPDGFCWSRGIGEPGY